MFLNGNFTVNNNLFVLQDQRAATSSSTIYRRNLVTTSSCRCSFHLVQSSPPRSSWIEPPTRANVLVRHFFPHTFFVCIYFLMFYDCLVIYTCNYIYYTCTKLWIFIINMHFSFPPSTTNPLRRLWLLACLVGKCAIQVNMGSWSSLTHHKSKCVHLISVKCWYICLLSVTYTSEEVLRNWIK